LKEKVGSKVPLELEGRDKLNQAGSLFYRSNDDIVHVESEEKVEEIKNIPCHRNANHFKSSIK
jgi:hypothetical protein